MAEQNVDLGDNGPEALRISEILEGISGAWETAQQSIEQAECGDVVSLSEL